MKKYTILITQSIGQGGSITYNEGNCNHLLTLSRFLYSDVQGAPAAEFYIDWLNNKIKCPGYTTNTHHLENAGDNFIITDIFIDDEDEPDDLHFKTSKKNLIKILKNWVKIKKTGSQKIHLTQEDDGSITFKAFNSQGNEIEIEWNQTIKEKIIAFFSKLKKKIFK